MKKVLIVVLLLVSVCSKSMAQQIVKSEARDEQEDWKRLVEQEDWKRLVEQRLWKCIGTSAHTSGDDIFPVVPQVDPVVGPGPKPIEGPEPRPYLCASNSAYSRFILPQVDPVGPGPKPIKPASSLWSIDCQYYLLRLTAGVSLPDCLGTSQVSAQGYIVSDRQFK